MIGRSHLLAGAVLVVGCSEILGIEDLVPAVAEPVPPLPDASCAPAPGGWTVVLPTPSSAPCASGIRQVLLENPRASDEACTCSCGEPSSNPCESIGGIHTFDTGSFGGPCGGGGGRILTEGKCDGASWSGNVSAVSGAPRSPAVVSCPGSGTLAKIVADSEVEVCTDPDQLCNPAACLMQDGGEQPCPAGFDVRRVVTAKEDVEDTRACGACTCNSLATSCTNAALTLFTDRDCTAGGRTAVFDGTCRPFDSTGFVPQSYRYRATPNVPGFAPVEPTSPVSGGVTSKKQTLLCCRS